MIAVIIELILIFSIIETRFCLECTELNDCK